MRVQELQPKAAESEIEAAAVPVVVKAAGGAVLGAGALAALVVVQMVTGFLISSEIVLVLIALAGLGLANMALGFLVMRARAWAAIAALVGCSLLFLANAAWLWISFRGGLLSLFAMGAPVVSFLAIVLLAFAIEPCRRATLARARLAAEGLDLGV